MIYVAHPLIALVIQALFAAIVDDWWIGAAAGSFYFIGREYAQAEHRNISQNYDNKRTNMPYWGGFEPRAWTLKGILDFVLPSGIVVIVALVAKKFNL